ncbi:MAG TPA: GNAT family N-acetyltransferase [Rhodanobacteraceae bacterium]|nr:GNAT family N-acetyltransferase [Rhodanobacteraceae bacterium]
MGTAPFPAIALLHRCRSLPRRLLRNFDTFVLCCDNTDTPLMEPAHSLHRLQGADPATVLTAQQVMQAAGEPVAVVAERLRQGDALYVLSNDGQWAAFSWICFMRRKEIGVWIAAAPTRAVLYNLFTLPAWRKRGLSQRLIRAIRAELAPQGWRELVASCNRENTASTQALTQAGFRPVLKTHRLLIADRYFTPIQIEVLEPQGSTLLEPCQAHR